MTDDKAALGGDWKEDHRPARAGWAPGDYINKCHNCGERFIGTKRAWLCADCAYALPETALLPAQRGEGDAALGGVEKELPCPRCDGSGNEPGKKVSCSRCYGVRTIRDMRCGGDRRALLPAQRGEQSCATCHGQGTILSRVGPVVCPLCWGGKTAQRGMTDIDLPEWRTEEVAQRGEGAVDDVERQWVCVQCFWNGKNVQMIGGQCPECKSWSGRHITAPTIAALPRSTEGWQCVPRSTMEIVRQTLSAAKQFIENGVALGFIRMPDPDTPDTAHNTLPAIKSALSLLSAAPAAGAERRGEDGGHE